MSSDLDYEPDDEPEAHARHGDPGTSHDAAASVENILVTQGLILDILIERGPLWDKAIWLYFVQKHGIGAASESGVRTRRSELVRKNLVRGTGEKQLLASGRQAIIWEVVR